MIKIKILFLLLLLLEAGCVSQKHYIKLEAEKFIGTIPGFGEVNVDNFRYWKAPGKADTDENIYEIPDSFWSGEFHKIGKEKEDD